ncbi:CDP-alcohol phosphatidyltransferase family protein [Nocardioides sp. CN2-186]|uniref:CDP-alcohol phosphatidyltransferase family protein n=1 Tax=Nocardioides tweenelious TaxID=3156607 RepID=UPI0032B3DCDE
MITLVRAGLAVTVAIIGPTGLGLALVVVALALDWVDGQVARRTHTESAFGARFDMETDAFLIAVLSVYVAIDAGWWVLLIGAARYLLWLAERVWPWLRRPVPPRHWRKVVAAVQGIVLAAAASQLLPEQLTDAALVVALALLAESFGRDVWWLRRTRKVDSPYPTGGGLTMLAIGVVWMAIVLPQSPGDLVQLPVEVLLVVAVALLPWRRVRLVAAVVLGVALGVVVVLQVFDTGFEKILDRPFDPTADWVYLGPGVGVLGDSIGVPAARATAVAAGVLVVAVLVLLPLATVRVARSVAGHRRAALVTSTVVVLAALTQVGSSNAAVLAYDEVVQVRADLADRRTFGHEIDTDAYADTSGDQLLPGLRGKDVLVVFVESYGRVAVQDTTYSPGVDAVLDDGTRRLAAAGFHARSGFLTSPTFGAASWLAHSTLQSGLWVDSQQRYEQLLGDDRLTLTSAFEKAGWRTVSDVPADTRDWPEGEDFYGFDQMYDSRNVGYQGPQFGYASMPDQFTLQRFQELELDPTDRSPVMGEIDLVSSHHPWAPSPLLVPWGQVGDGSVFDGAPTQPSSSDVQTLYGQSIEYTMGTLVSWLEQHPDPNLVLVVLGDHQPHSYVSGSSPGHDVPISVIAQDPSVLHRIRSWGWDTGLHPAPDAPVWPMDSFRDRFLATFGPI